MNFCTKCGKELSDGICNTCEPEATAVIVPEVVVAGGGEVKFCTKCGAKKDGEICTACAKRGAVSDKVRSVWRFIAARKVLSIAVAAVVIAAVTVTPVIAARNNQPLAFTADALGGILDLSGADFEISVAGQKASGAYALGNDFKSSVFYVKSSGYNIFGRPGEYAMYQGRITGGGSADDIVADARDNAGIDLNALVKNKKIDGKVLGNIVFSFQNSRGGGSGYSGAAGEADKITRDFLVTECAEKAVSGKFLSGFEKVKADGGTSYSYKIKTVEFLKAYVKYAKDHVKKGGDLDKYIKETDEFFWVNTEDRLDAVSETTVNVSLVMNNRIFGKAQLTEFTLSGGAYKISVSLSNHNKPVIDTERIERALA